MITASELAGFIAAHAAWSLSDTETFAPMLAFTTEDGQRKLERLTAGDATTAVAYGRQRLDADPFSANDGVLAYDGRTWAGTMDAILLELRSYGFPCAKATIAVPYAPRTPGPFRVRAPELLEWERCEDFDPGAAIEAFVRGVAAHGPGTEAWNAARDGGR
ncbi:MAG TPA: hypothetical protein VH092_10190 [Urbifossiella sp.]|nr:hypothetical protein [Urbifossiella sp.]